MKPYMQDDSYSVGANYWASPNAINMWSEWDAKAVEEDFRALSAQHIKTLRVFPLWPVFQPIKAMYANEIIYEYRMMPGERPLPDTEAGQAGVSEEACGHFAQLCALAEQYDIKLVVALLTGHMSFRFYAPEAFEGKNYLSDPTTIKWELRFIRYFVKRFREESSIIAWELGNECNCVAHLIEQDQAYVWAAAVTGAIRESDGTRPVISGLYGTRLGRENFNIRETAELLDIQTSHPYQIFSTTGADPICSLRPSIEPAFSAQLCECISRKPAFVEETGAIGYLNASENTEAGFMRTILYSTWAQGLHGLFWWCAFDQGKLEYAPYDWNNIGSDYGLFRADRSPKPLVLEAKKFTEFIASLPFDTLPRHSTEAVCVVPRELENAHDILLNTYLLAKQANIDLDFCLAEDKLPEAQLYLLPSVGTTKPMFLHRLNELLDRVRLGASLYLSLGDTLFRRLPELTGLTFAARYARTAPDTITFRGQSIPLANRFKYQIERVADTCEVLAADQDETPVFVRNQYGKGSIYFISAPLERLAALTPGAFSAGADAPRYHVFYQAFAEAATRSRVAVCRDPNVLLSEHALDDRHRVIVAVNHGAEDSAHPLHFRTGWIPSQVFRGTLTDTSLHIPGCDAAVWMMEKE